MDLSKHGEHTVYPILRQTYSNPQKIRDQFKYYHTSVRLPFFSVWVLPMAIEQNISKPLYPAERQNTW